MIVNPQKIEQLYYDYFSAGVCFSTYFRGLLAFIIFTKLWPTKPQGKLMVFCLFLFWEQERRKTGERTNASTPDFWISVIMSILLINEGMQLALPFTELCFWSRSGTLVDKIYHPRHSFWICTSPVFLCILQLIQVFQVSVFGACHDLGVGRHQLIFRV